MITCFFEDGGKAKRGLRHVTVGAVAYNNEGQVLLVKRAITIHNGGKYSIPGGFLDRNETTAQATLRELQEETGFTGEIVSIFHINDNPHRPKEDRKNVDVLYLVKVISGNSVYDSEVSAISWFDKKTLPHEAEFAFDHYKAILKFFDYQKKSFSLPLMGEL